MRPRCAPAATLLLVLASCGGTAQAHTQLKKFVPAAGATVATAPSEMRLQFDASIEANMSQLSVETPAGQSVAAGPAAIDPNDKTAVVLRLPEPLTAGAYKVTWRVISADMHRVRGSFTFPRFPTYETRGDQVRP